MGEQLRYVVTDGQDQWLALMGWSAPALHLKARDQSIEWSEEQRERRLHLLAQNSRFVILAEREQLPNLASRAMSLCLARLSADWLKEYGHPVVMVESFVDRQLFRATAYKASGWQALGYSSGFKRVAEDFYERHDRPKELWVKTLDARAWGWLRAQPLPEHLRRYEKKTPPACAVATEAMHSLFERFDQIADWRKPIGKRHRLSTVMALVALACLSGAGQGYRSVSRFAKRLTKLQRRALRCWINPNTGQAQFPSESVVQRVLQKVPRLEVESIAVGWQNDLLGAALDQTELKVAEANAGLAAPGPRRPAGLAERKARRDEIQKGLAQVAAGGRAHSPPRRTGSPPHETGQGHPPFRRQRASRGRRKGRGDRRRRSHPPGNRLRPTGAD